MAREKQVSMDDKETKMKTSRNEKCDPSSMLMKRRILPGSQRSSSQIFASTLEGYMIDGLCQDNCSGCERRDKQRYSTTTTSPGGAGLTRFGRIHYRTFVQILVILQSAFLVTSQAFPVGCQWSSSISPTMPDFQTLKLTGCSYGRLNWHMPYKARQVEATFQETTAGGPFQMCFTYKDPRLNDLMTVTDRTDEREQVLQRVEAGEEICVQSGQDNNVVLNFKLQKTESPIKSANDIDYSDTKNIYEIQIDYNRYKLSS